MGAHSRASAAASAHQCLQAPRDTRGLIGNRSHTHTHTLLVRFTHQILRTCDYIQSLLRMHTLSHTKLLAPQLIDCGTISHTHLHSSFRGFYVFPKEAPQGGRKGVSLLFLMKSLGNKRRPPWMGNERGTLTLKDRENEDPPPLLMWPLLSVIKHCSVLVHIV